MRDLNPWSTAPKLKQKLQLTRLIHPSFQSRDGSLCTPCSDQLNQLNVKSSLPVLEICALAIPLRWVSATTKNKTESHEKRIPFSSTFKQEM